MKLEIPLIRKLRSCTWFKENRNKLANSTADRWVFVLLGVERGKHDYVVIKPRELLAKLKNLEPNSQQYQAYIWVTQERGSAKSKVTPRPRALLYGHAIDAQV